MKYNINNNNLPILIFRIKRTLEESKEKIKKLLDIDYKYCKTQINIDILLDVSNHLQNETLSANKMQKAMIHYNGHPYITLNLGILAILTKTPITLEFDECMLGINTFIVETINNLLKDFETDKLIFIESRSNKNSQNIDKIICIDDINRYNTYLYQKNHKVKFYSFSYIDFYSDTDKYEELTELIYKYAENNMIPIESYSEFKANEAMQLIKDGFGSKIILLTDNEETKRTFKTNIQNKKIYINENPFTKEMQIIKKDILL